jgi:hypothetical protein
VSRRLPPHQRLGANLAARGDRLARRVLWDPGADVCRSYLLLKLHAKDIAEPYLDAYCGINNMPRAKILDWLPYVAAARLAEDVPDDFERSLEIVHS